MLRTLKKGWSVISNQTRSKILSLSSLLQECECRRQWRFTRFTTRSITRIYLPDECHSNIKKDLPTCQHSCTSTHVLQIAPSLLRGSLAFTTIIRIACARVQECTGTSDRSVLSVGEKLLIRLAASRTFRLTNQKRLLDISRNFLSIFTT